MVCALIGPIAVRTEMHVVVEPLLWQRNLETGTAGGTTLKMWGSVGMLNSSTRPLSLSLASGSVEMRGKRKQKDDAAGLLRLGISPRAFVNARL